MAQVGKQETDTIGWATH